jgi:molybdopterin molybdotransferase
MSSEVFILKGASKSENVFYKASDISVGDIVVSKGTKITPFTIGALNSLGINHISVYKPLNATIISTGNELVGNKETIEIGEIRDINTSMISSYLANKNINVINTIIIRDNLEEYTNAVKQAFSNSDIVICSGGSSVGEEDYTVKVLEELDAELYVHGVNIKPGKPTIIGKYNNKMFLGLPGQPTSAYMVFNTLFPTIYNTIHKVEKEYVRPHIEATLTKNVHSPSGRRMYQLVTLESKEDKQYATPLFKKSGMIHSLVQADGYIIISEYAEGAYEGDNVKVYRLED